jgi:GTP-binding protein HflX
VIEIRQEDVKDRFVLAGIYEHDKEEGRERLAELKDLVEAADGVVVGELLVKRGLPDAGTYLGKGRLNDLVELVRESNADAVVFDAELTPGQAAQVGDAVEVDVIDRTALILEVFARHARSQAAGARAPGPMARAQVELAELEYALPRLRGRGGTLAQQSGRRGTRQGSGESALELDRRRIRARIDDLRRDLKDQSKRSELGAKARRSRPVPAVALVGRTNAGKSSLLHAMTGREVFVDAALFATLEATVGRASTPGGRVFTVSDTVGFLRDLPSALVDAFRATLTEVTHADVLLQVVDASDPRWRAHLKATREVLAAVGVGEVPEVIVANKGDLLDEDARKALEREGAVVVSALTGEGLTELAARVGEVLEPLVELDVVVGFEHLDLVSAAHDDGEVVLEEFTEEGTHIVARVHPALASALEGSALHTE